MFRISGPDILQNWLKHSVYNFCQISVPSLQLFGWISSETFQFIFLFRTNQGFFFVLFCFGLFFACLVLFNQNNETFFQLPKW